MYDFDPGRNDGQFDDDWEYNDSAAGDAAYGESDWDSVHPEGDEDIPDIDDNQPDAATTAKLTITDREEQPRLQIFAPEEIGREVRRLGATVAAEAVVVGSCAAYLALGNDIRTPKDLDVSVSAGAYAYLRSQPGWQEQDNGKLSNGAYDVGVGWGDKTQGELEQRSWRTADGVKVASLPDVVTWKNWTRGEPKDLADVKTIRERLLDPTKPPLPNEVIADEIAIARSCLPEHLRDDSSAQVAIELAANGLATVRTLYGDDRIGQANPIIGDLERPEYGVVATYHNGFDLPQDMRLLQRHMENIGATDEQRLEAMAADAYSDIVYGNGRRSDNPENYDELRSANLLAAHATMKGYNQAAAERYRQSVLGTGFDEKTGSQAGRHHPDPVVRAVAGIDLQTLSEPNALIGSMDIAVEDGMSARFSPARTLGQAAAEWGVRISSTQDGLQFIDAYQDARPADAPEGPAVREAFGRRLLGNAGFIDPRTGYKPPDGWTLENQANRFASADRLRGVANRLLAGEITAEAAYREAEEHSQRLAGE